jgi:hypothetical protein
LPSVAVAVSVGGEDIANDVPCQGAPLAPNRAKNPVPDTDDAVPDTTKPVPDTDDAVPDTIKPVPDTTKPVPDT